MAKKNKRLDKDTRRLIESISDVTKRGKDGNYRFKGIKKKEVKTLKKTCIHWMSVKGEYRPMLEPYKNDWWRCKICGKSFRSKTLTLEEYRTACEGFLSIVEQCAFYATWFGGNADDLKVFINLKRDIPRFEKISRNLMKKVKERDEYDRKREDALSGNQFGGFSSFHYN